MVNLPAIFIANGIGLILLLGILFGHSLRLQKKVESIMLYIITILLITSCILDPLMFVIDGRPGLAARIFNYAGNLWLYLTNIIFSSTYLLLIERNSAGKNSRMLITVVAAIDIPAILILLLNLFEPMVYYIDENNMYHRLSFFLLYSIIGLVFMAMAIALYIKSRIKGGVFQFFPVAHFIIPMLTALIIQYNYYGISLIWPSAAVGLSLMLMSMQNRNILMDKLTGLFNRNYLKAVNFGDKPFCMMMLDLNDFKSINDNYGHSEGDAALVAAAQAMTEAVGNRGTAVRYAGDEFVILLNTSDKNEGLACSERINRNLEHYNSVSKKPYKLSISARWDVYDLSKESFDDIFKSVDELMYEAKQKYYTVNDRRRRH